MAQSSLNIIENFADIPTYHVNLPHNIIETTDQAQFEQIFSAAVPFDQMKQALFYSNSGAFIIKNLPLTETVSCISVFSSIYHAWYH